MPYANKPSRREFLAWSAALAAGAGSCRAPQSPAPSPSLSSNELIELSATDAVRAMREGELEAEDYAAALLERCEAGKHLNAFITLDADRVLEAARAAGLPGIVLPAGLSKEGLPVSIELDGPTGNDREILAIGLAVEQVLGSLPAPTLDRSSESQ